MQPLWSKVLSKTDTSVRLEFPTKDLVQYSFPEEHDHYVEFWVTDSDQDGWNFRLAKRKKGGHPKPAITGHWLRYVKKKGLKEGDEVILYKLEGEAGAVHYRIAVKKKILQLMGSVIRVDEDQVQRYRGVA